MREITDPNVIASIESGYTEHPMSAYGAAVRHVESRGNPNATSPKGAMGADQFMPETARAMGLADPRDPMMSGVARDLLLAEEYARFKDPHKALAAYNAGSPAIMRADARGQPYPKETQEYVPKVLAAMGIGSAQAAEQPRMREITDPEVIARLEAQSQQPEKKAALPKATKSYATQGAEQALADTSPWMRPVVGAGMAVDEVLNAGKRLFGMKTENNKEANRVLMTDPLAMAGNVAGEIALTAVPGTLAYKGATAIPRIANAVGPVGRVLRAAVGGSAAGATGETMLGRDPLEGAAMGAVLGPVLEKAVSAVGSIGRTGLNAFGGTEGRVSQQLRGAFDNPDAAAAHLRAQTPDLPGERLTVGSAATPDFPEFKAFETQARNSPGADRLLRIDANNQAAREGVVDRIARQGRAGEAGFDQQIPLSPAAGRRQAATNPLYEAANPERVTVNPILQSLLDGQELQTAVREGQSAFNQKQMLDLANNRPTSPSHIAADPDTGAPAVYSIDELQHIKNKISEQIDRVRMTDPEKAHRLNETRRALTQEMEAQSGNYQQATQTYRTMSQPQNSGMVAQELLDALRSPAGKERAPAFLGAMRNAPSTLQNALGKSRFQQIGQVMTPDQMRQLRNVQRSVERNASVDALQVPEGVVNRYRSLFDQIEDMSPPYFSQVVTTLRKALRVLGRRSDEAVERTINEAIVDPARFATLMETLPPGERNAVINSMTRLFSQNREIAGGVVGTIAGQSGQE